MEPASEDPETFEQLRHIQKLLADVQAEFQPVAATEPEVELVFETPHPFAETFEEEEVINDRYAAAAAPLTPNRSVAAEGPPAAVEVAAQTDEAELERTIQRREEAEPQTVPMRVEKPHVGREDMQPGTIPMPHDRKAAWNDGREAEVAAATATVEAVAEEPAPRPTPRSCRRGHQVLLVDRSLDGCLPSCGGGCRESCRT